MSGGMLIVGAGECGGRAALALRERGYTGPVTLVGREPHPPYERPPLSKAAIAADAELPPKLIADRQALADRRIECLFGLDTLAIDRAGRTVTLADGTMLAYDRLLLATGAVPRRLPLPGADGKRCAYLRTHDDALRIRRALNAGCHVAILGGGFIGLELAASARRRGARVTVIEALPRILTRGVPEEIARVIETRHRSEGVTIACGKGISTLQETRSCIEIAFSDGESIAADLLVIGIGAVPATELAEKAGLAIENGIAVDAQLRTSDPAIYAAGDCCSFPLSTYGGRRIRLESWRNAVDQGPLAARNMLGAGESAAAIPWFWSDQYDLTMQIAGLPDAGERLVRRELGDDAIILFHLADDGHLVAASGIARGNAIARDIRVAEMLIARQAAPDPAALAQPRFKLKSLLAA
ncbi:MAG TPA: FAD-dependent oxidoreductase [Dongiaceae bacterium]|nr:FAD-dependent oxidoreductase [Dongiaceae bacterium]